MILDEIVQHCEEVAENYRYQRDDCAEIVENDFIVEMFDGKWSNKFARVVTIDVQNNTVLLDIYSILCPNFAICNKFFHTPLESPFQTTLTIIQHGYELIHTKVNFIKANQEQLRICYDAINNTKKICEQTDYVSFFDITHLSSDVLDVHIREFNNDNSITNETLRILNSMM